MMIMKKLLFLILITFNFSSVLHALESFDIYQVLEKSTVRITIWDEYDNDENKSTFFGGSGIVINRVDDKYFILTNAHVVLEKYCLFYDEECEDTWYDSTKTIVVDSVLSNYEYPVNNRNIVFWGRLDLAVIMLDLSLIETDDIFKAIPIGGVWHPLMPVYGAGFPIVLGNNKEYRDIFYCSGEINSAILDEEGLSELLNYSMVHSCGISGGMSGGPLIDDKGKLLGINGLIGDAQFKPSEVGDIGSVDFDNLKYAYSIHIYDLYEAVISHHTGNFTPGNSFYNFIPRLSLNEHQTFYLYLKQKFSNQENSIDKLFFKP